MRRLLPLLALALLLAGPASRAETLETRLAAVGEAIAAADAMYASAKKGHLPSLEAINALRARLALAKALHAEAQQAAAAGRAHDAGARLEAARYLADAVYEASKH